MPMTPAALDDEGRDNSSPRNEIAPITNLDFKFRVRTGCIVCRMRKVKCDEEKPNCRKCRRLNRPCIYRAIHRRGPRSMQTSAILGTVGYQDDKDGERSMSKFAPEHTEPDSRPAASQIPESIPNPRAFDVLESLASVVHTGCSPPADANASPLNRYGLGYDQHESDTTSISGSLPAQMEEASQVICFCTTTDWLSAFDATPKSSLAYFIEEVDSPIISPFDHLNWKRIKIHVAQLGTREPFVAAALSAAEALYRAQANRMPMTRAMSQYHAAVTSFEAVLRIDAIDFQTILVVAFLLCLSVTTLPNEDRCTLHHLEGPFSERLEAWLLNGRRSPVASRICAWLQMFHVATRRGGSPGLLPTPVSNILSRHVTHVPEMLDLEGPCPLLPTDALYDTSSSPVFGFYLELQAISNQVANMSHYNRSRVTPLDQTEVTVALGELKASMCSLWRSRPGPLRYEPRELRKHLSPAISEPLIVLSRVCTAAYLAEVVAIGRTLGFPPFAAPEAREAMSQIRKIVDDDWEASGKGTLNAGYLRPLFLYAIESLRQEDTRWAADRLKQIKCPISRSEFIASFVEALGKAQRDKQRRVTMKYFCMETFGVPVPYM